jgi:hypothetical protein
LPPWDDRMSRFLIAPWAAIIMKIARISSAG